MEDATWSAEVQRWRLAAVLMNTGRCEVLAYSEIRIHEIVHTQFSVPPSIALSL
jgi:hypothetical protein